MQSQSQSGSVSKFALWTGRVVSALPVLALCMSAFMKLSKNPQAIEGMKKFGYPDHLLIPLGVVEVACTLIYLIPQTAVLGAVLLTGYLGGAVATHVRMSESPFMPILIGVLVWLGLVLRDRRLRSVLPLRR